jgi:hypothetical protein
LLDGDGLGELVPPGEHAATATAKPSAKVRARAVLTCMFRDVATARIRSAMPILVSDRP